MTLFESPFVGSGLCEAENNALRVSSLLVVPPPPPDVRPLEGLQGTNLTEANLTQWASDVQDVALGMQRPPCAAMECPKWDIAGVLHRLENLTGVSFCHLCYTLGNTCGCAGATHQAPHSYGSTALRTLPQPSYASMASSMTTTAGTSMRGASSTMGPPSCSPTLEVPTSMDVSPGYNLLAHAGVGRGFRPQSKPGSARAQMLGATGLHQPQPLAPRQPAAASGGQEAHPATPYQQVVHPPQQVRFAPPTTKEEATMSQSQSVAKRGRPQTREQGGCWEHASHPRTRKDQSFTRGPKRQRGITSKDPMEDLMDFVPSGWRRDLTHTVGCFYASQINPLNTHQWYSNRDKFLQAMEERKGEWLNIKELELLSYM